MHQQRGSQSGEGSSEGGGAGGNRLSSRERGAGMIDGVNVKTVFGSSESFDIALTAHFEIRRVNSGAGAAGEEAK